MIWNRKYSTPYARREDGITIRPSANSESEVVISDAVGQPVGSLIWLRSVETWAGAVDRLVQTVDTQFPPGDWRWEDGKWLRGEWTVATEEIIDSERTITITYALLGPVGRRYFSTPDRARQFADLADGIREKPRRGPKARAGKPATVVLPDVRVTPEEREAATSLAKSVGMSYADLIRASLAFIRTEVIDHRNVVAVRRHDTDTTEFVDVTAFMPNSKKPTIRVNETSVPVTVLTPKKES